MQATVMYRAGEVRLEKVPDPVVHEPTDALVRITLACICGSDLWPYKLLQETESGRRMGHEAIGVVEAVGRDVRRIRAGDLVIRPFAYSDGVCDFCQEGLRTSCSHGGFFGTGGKGDGAQAEAIRVPYADGTLFPLPAAQDETLMASLLTLSDVMGTGHHAALCARVQRGKPAAVIGDGAVGLCGVIACQRLGAAPIVMLGRRPQRTHLATQFGATHIVSDRGEEAVARIRELTAGAGVHAVLECVGSEAAIATAVGIVRAGGAIGRVGVPHYETVPGIGSNLFYNNVTICGGPAPVRSYIDELLPDILEGRIQPGRVFDSVIDLKQIAAGYRAMDERTALKVMVKP